MYTVTILGAGNVATHISRHLHVQGYRISQVWSKSREHAESLAQEFGAEALWGEEPVNEGADFYMMSLTDDAITKVAELHKGLGGIWFHTAGSVELKVLEDHFRDCGVLYPLMSISRDKEVCFDKIPLLLEASSDEVLFKLRTLAERISEVVRVVDSGRRLAIHLAAVFANNFSNHMVHLACRIMEESGEDFRLLLPLLEESMDKIRTLGPSSAQTGPARRGDDQTMEKHLALLKKHPEWEKLYTFVSRSIQDEQF